MEENVITISNLINQLIAIRMNIGDLPVVLQMGDKFDQLRSLIPVSVSEEHASDDDYHEKWLVLSSDVITDLDE